MLSQLTRNFRLIREPFTSALIKQTELIVLESKYIIVQQNSIAQGKNKWYAKLYIKFGRLIGLKDILPRKYKCVTELIRKRERRKQAK